MTGQHFKAFGDELTKIAFYQKLRNGFVDALKAGWHGTPEQVRSGQGATWFGQGRQIKPGMSYPARAMEEATSLGGLTKALPVGAKSMMLLGTGLMARDALRQDDPSGMNRSRKERMVGLAGNTIGGLAGAGLAAKFAPGSKFLAPVAGGMLGGMAGEKILTAPWGHHQTNIRQYAAQQVPVPQEYWPQYANQAVAQ